MFKRILSALLSISLMFVLVACGNEQNNTNSVSSITSGIESTQPNNPNALSLGDTWRVDNEWELTITSVSTHYNCNMFGDYYNDSSYPVVQIDFKYKNIGHSGYYIYDNLIFESTAFEVYDNDGCASLEAVGCTHVPDAKGCVVNTACEASYCYTMKQNANIANVTINVSHYNSNFDKVSTVYVVPVSKSSNNNNNNNTSSSKPNTNQVTSKPSTNTQNQTSSNVVSQECAHVYSDATCVTPRTCKKCGETKGSPNSSHDYANPTCTEPFTCKLCGKTYGNPKGHQYNYDTCGVCGNVIKLSITVEYSSNITYTYYGDKLSFDVLGYKFDDVDRYEEGWANVLITTRNVVGKLIKFRIRYYNRSGTLLDDTIGLTSGQVGGERTFKSRIPASTTKIVISEFQY